VTHGLSMLALPLLLCAVLFSAGDPRAGSPFVVVVASVGVEAHRSAVEGIQAAMGMTPSEIRVLDLAEARSEQKSGVALAAPGIRVIIAVGSEALEIVNAGHPAVPVISTMVLRHAADKGLSLARAAATVSLDVSIEDMIAHLKKIFPDKTRLGIIRNPASSSGTPAQLQARAQSLGFLVRVVDATSPDQLLPALMSLKGHVDLVWCMPDGTLYNSVTIKPLILASLENRLPLIGFSESFARAGAVLGVYPDFRDIGLQTGEAARQIMENQAVHVPDGPRKLKLAVNQSVLRLSGLRYSVTAAAGEKILVLR
jgi:putative tryptophan/tyrosine transport system substrate-binding protein